MNETYGTDAERRLGRKDKAVGVRLSEQERARFQQVVQHLGVPPSVWVRHVMLHTVESGRRGTAHEALRGQLHVFRQQVRGMGPTGPTLVERVQGAVVQEFTALLQQLAPSTKLGTGLRWALWTQGAVALARPGKADLVAAYNALHQHVYDPTNRAEQVEVQPVTGYINPRDLR
jgi:hypothetical protein